MNIPTQVDPAPASGPLSYLVRGNAAGGVAPGERTPGALNQYVRIFRKRKWLIAGIVFGAFLIGLFVTLLATPKYTATTQVEISRTSDKITGVQDVKQDAQIQDQEFYQTQYGLLRSNSLAERVVQALRLQDDENFSKAMGAQSPSDGEAATQNREARIRRAAGLLLSHVDIAPIRGSSLVEINFTSASPALSAKIANSWADSFIQSNLERRFESTSYARKFLEGRLAQLRQRLEESERQAVAYSAQQGLISVGSPSANGADAQQPQLLVADNLARLNAELASATAARIIAESSANNKSGGASPEALNSQSLASLRSRRAELAAEYARLMQQFEPGYPPAQALQMQIASIDTALGREEGRIGQSFRNDYRAAVARENALRDEVNKLKAQLVADQGRGIQQNIYQRDADTNRQLYEALLQRYKEIGVAGGVGTNNVSVIDPADVPNSPSSPNLLLNMILSLLFGTILGVGAALGLEQIDDVVSDPTDVGNTTGLPLLGTVPLTDAGRDEDLYDPKSALTEAYVAIQTALQFSTPHGFPRSVVVTSTRPAEGKSTTSLSLALGQQRRGNSVILVDADMRSPTVHKVTGGSNTRGVSNYLTGEDNLDTLVNRGADGQLDTLYAGPQPPNAADLLANQRFEQLIKDLSARYAVVVVDAPPVMGLADAPLIASAVEATVYVVEAHTTPTSLIRLALQRLRASRANVLGIALTKFQSEKSHYGYGYDYGYNYRDTSEA